jgi:hypothetical protein
MSRVFIPQLVERYDRASGGFVPVHDFSSAAEFGALTAILPKEADPLFLTDHVQAINAALKGFIPSLDYFVAVGDPSIIAVCAGVILRKWDSFRMLKWDKKINRYITLEICP